MRILHLVSKETYDHKLSRVRFHAIDAIGRMCTVKRTGPGWAGFTSADQEVKNFKPNFVIWYKPLTIPGYEKVNVPKCTRYNEMYAIGSTKKEIIKSKSDLVICHHSNDIKNYKGVPAKFVHIPHCAEKAIFKDYGLPKKYDVSLVGMISWAYPFRERLHRLLYNKLPRHWKYERKKHPGYKIGHTLTEEEPRKFAQFVNQSKITLTCSSKFKYALSKYAEIPMCNSILAGDLPDERQDFFRQFMIVLDPNDSDGTIINKLNSYLVDDKKRQELSNKGMNIALQNMTQEHYAKNFLDTANAYLQGKL